MINKTKTDPYTGEQFEPKRSNQRFASPSNKNAFHNQKAKEDRGIMATINKSLQQNRRILKRLLGDKNEGIFTEQFLLGAGYNFYAYTSSEKNATGFNIYEFKISSFEGKLKVTRRNQNG